MASQITISSIYSGQMLWAYCSKSPYWPAIVCASDSGDIKSKNKSREQQSVHVRFCANSRRSCFVDLENVFVFTGYESFAAKKRSMKSKLSADDFNKAFDAESDESWRKAVIEATFILSKDLGSRVVIFDALNMIEDINSELSKIACNITFGEANTKAPQKIAPRVTFDDAEPSQITKPPERRSARLSHRPEKLSSKVQPEVEKFESANSSKAAKQCNQKERRRSEQSQITKQTEQRLGRWSVPAKTVATRKLTKYEEFERDLLTYNIRSYPKKILFQGIRQGNVCKICCSTNDRNDGNLVKCSACGDHVHSNCLNNNNDESYVRLPEELGTEQRKRTTIRIKITNKLFCNECAPTPICFACKEATTSQLIECNVKSCGRFYHSSCLDNGKQIEFIDEKLKCPLHVCHTCVSAENDNTALSMKFTVCIKCPTTYHLNSCCIPAGTKILSEKQHICIRHRESHHAIPSLHWCESCTKKDGELLCCGSCPKSYHKSCLGSSEVPDPFLCETCSNGKNPLYGEMILAKFGNHLWWPAVIVPSFKIPAHMHEYPLPNDHEFCVRFFGDYDFGWIGRSSVHYYSKIDAAKLLDDDPKQRDAFTQAAKWFDKIHKDTNGNELQNVALEKNKTQTSRQQPLPPFIKITTLNLVAPAKQTKTKDESSPCSCKPNDDDPCGPTSHCENRAMCMECEAKCCPSGSKCRNQCFERKIFPDVKVVFVDDKKGFGLIADQFICAGTLVAEYVGELITEKEFQLLQSRKHSQRGTRHHYFMTYSKGLYIDAEKKGNESRFVNHSCDPNCQIEKWTVNKVERIGYVALKDIEKDTEITTNYDFDAGDKVHECFCGESRCIGVIGSQNLNK